MRIVVALGGNALLRRGEPAEAAVQRANVAEAAAAVAELAGREEVVLTHGNGPQVGLLALQAEAYEAVAPYPLDVLGAETEGMIGYMLEQELRNRIPGREVATLLTQVLVDPSDPAFERPTKPVGPVYEREVAERLRESRGWSIAPDGEFFRRVVPSPEPLDVLGLPSIACLIEAGALVICAGGGGIPVMYDCEGALRGVEGVIDKDLAAALLAERLGADMLVMLTDVEAVQSDWGTPAAAPIRRADPGRLRALDFASGSMGPKVDAACRFVERTGGRAAIGRLADAARIVAGEAGTLVVPAQVPAGAGGVTSPV
jgi:carbamate kinase